MSGDSKLATLSSPNSDALIATASTAAAQYLIFLWQGLRYAVDILAVQEIHWLPQLTPLAESAPYIVGAINLRGRIVPVMDLSLRLRRPAQPYSVDDCLIFLEYDNDLIGIIVNKVQDVQRIAASQIEAVPSHTASTDTTALVSGVAKINDQIVMVVDLGHLVQASQQEKLDRSLAAPEGNTQERQTSATLFGEYFSTEEQTLLRERSRQLATLINAETTGDHSPVALLQLRDEHYGVALDSVREFCKLRLVSPVPCCPEHIIGQMNLRGDIITLVDIQPLLNLPSRSSMANDRGTVVVVQDGAAPVGVIVDEVFDVLYVNREELETPAVSQISDTKYFRGGILHNGRMIYLLDLDRVLSEGNLVVDETV